jgi:regulator of protease activity HflC (stomatin/prohibitin superfamily)
MLLQERNAAVIRAEGESEAAKLISDATKAAGAGMVELRRIEAAKDIAGEQCAGVLGCWAAALTLEPPGCVNACAPY